MKRSGEEELNLWMDEAVTMKEEISEMENRDRCFLDKWKLMLVFDFS